MPQPRTSTPQANISGMLLMEAIMASFLMVLAFLAAVKLYGASLQWEASTGKIRLATLLAERKMEELRAQTAQIPSGESFAEHYQNVVSAGPFSYSEAPNFSISVKTLNNTHKKVQSSGLTPTDGVHSPSSTFYTEPSSGPGAPYSFDPEGDYQYNATYESYPYSRHMPKTYRLVQVTVRWGPDPADSVRLLSLLGDPILARKDTGNSADIDQTVKVVKESGPDNLTGSTPAIYTVEVTTGNGAKVEDVSVLWSIHADGSGIPDLFVLNAKGTRVRVSRPAGAESGQRFRLFPTVRYKGVEARGYSPWINL